MPTKNSFGALTTVFEIPEDATKEMVDAIEKTPLPSTEVQAEEQLEQLKKDIRNRANELMKQSYDISSG